jgi:cystathionine beta-lyase/cystathionine gamma-synthase
MPTDPPKGMRPETLAVSHGYDPAMGMGSVKPPIFMTSTFVYPSAQAAKDVHEAFFDGTGPAVGAGNHIYSRPSIAARRASTFSRRVWQQSMAAKRPSPIAAGWQHIHRLRWHSSGPVTA